MPKTRPNGDGGLFAVRWKKDAKGDYYVDRDGNRTHATLYRGFVHLGLDAAGNPIRKYVHAKTMAECRKRLDKIKVEIANHGAPVDRRTTLAEYARGWVRTMEASKAPKTARGYKGSVENWIVPTLGERIRLADVRPSDMEKIKAAIRAKDKGTPTMRVVQVALSLILAAAVADGLIPRNPIAGMETPGETVRKKKKAAQAVSKNDREALTEDETTAILATAARLDFAAGSRWWFKIMTGARQGEIVGARLADLDLDSEHPTYTIAWQMQDLARKHGCVEDGQAPTCGKKQGARCPQARWAVPDDFEKIQVVGAWHWTRPKSEHGIRIVPLIPALAETIRRHLDATKDWPNPYGLVWRNPDGSPIIPKQDGQEWTALLGAAGVSPVRDGKPITGHWARHTAVTILAQMGVDLQVIGELVGHYGEEMTRQYRHARESERRAAMAKLANAWPSLPGLGAP